MLVKIITMSVASSTFHWTDAYRVNIAVLDRQHQKLFDVVNELDQALRVGEGNAVLDAILQKLVEYALTHFVSEESLMQRYSYPALTTHRTQHEMFRRKIAGFIEDHRAGKPGVPVTLLQFMQDWLRQHLLRTDKLYSAYLNARGVR
jgi:hemerythrin-like metal-binding protein